MPLSPLLTTQEVAAILRVNVRTVQRLVRDRRIPVCFGAGRHWKFTEEDLVRYIRDTTVIATKPPKRLRVVRKQYEAQGQNYDPSATRRILPEGW
jgi:excisionase family DNA binding protein